MSQIERFNNYSNYHLSPTLKQLRQQRAEILQKIENIQTKWQTAHTSAGKSRYKVTLTNLEEQLASCEISIIKLTQNETDLKREREEFNEYVSRILIQKPDDPEINAEEEYPSFIDESMIEDPTKNITRESFYGPMPWELIGLSILTSIRPNKYTSTLYALAGASRIAYTIFLRFNTFSAPLKEIAGQPVRFYKCGKVKQVYIPIYQSKNEPFVFYVAKVNHVFDSLYNLKSIELYNEVQTTYKIRFILHKMDLLDLFKNKKIKNFEKLIDQLFAKFNSLNQLIEALERGNASEFQELMSLKEDIKAIAKKEHHLATDYEEIADGDPLYRRYIVRTTLAKGDLEKVITKINFKTKISFILDILEGWEKLHRAGLVHGDPKLENILVYEINKKLIVRLSDFGKTRPIKDNEDLIYLGNGRHEPYERRLSKQGEVYSAAIIIIRILEEEFLNAKGWLLDKDNNVVKPHIRRVSSVKIERKGIEKFLLKNAKVRQMETISLSGKVAVYSQRILRVITSFNFSEEQETKREIELYINALTNKLESSNRMDSNQVTTLNGLLKNMIKIDRMKRPTLKEVHTRFQRLIFQ